MGLNKQAFRMPALARYVFRNARIGTAPPWISPVTHTHRENDPELIPANPELMIIPASADMPVSGFRFSKGILKDRIVSWRLVYLMVKSAN